ncbi:MAG: hypothetical protein RL308_2219, partial [Bacteroidota bacterium]
LGLSNIYYLRILNVFIVLYFINRTLQSNIIEGKKEYLQNAIAAGATAIIGVTLSVIGLYIYIIYRGGETYIHQLSNAFIIGNKSSVNEFCLGLFFEGIASSVIVTLIVMQYWSRQMNID